GEWVELEVLGYDAWTDLWTALGVRDADLAGAWAVFVFRYLTARCALPAALHEATARHTVAELRRVAEPSGIAVCPVRGYAELLADPGLAEHASWEIRAGPVAPLRRLRQSEGDGPLGGLRVVEVTSRLQGPLAGLLLQMLGAEVVKV